MCDKLQFEIKKGSTYVPLAKHQKFGELISGLPNIEAKISEMFSVEGDQKNLFFIKGTSLEEIKRKFKIRGSYHYFTEAFVELE